MLNIFRTRWHQGQRTLRFPDTEPTLPPRFRGRPVLDASRCPEGCSACVDVCSTHAITRAADRLALDMGRCLFCADCTDACPKGAIALSSEFRLAERIHARLVVRSGDQAPPPGARARRRAVTAAPRRIALVSSPGEARAALAGYLTSAGFDVHECDELAIPSSFGALVVIIGPETSIDRVVGGVRSWIKLTKIQRVVIVTSKPMAWKQLLASHGERLIVLPAPAFGWDLIDALRATEPFRPRGA